MKAMLSRLRKAGIDVIMAAVSGLAFIILLLEILIKDVPEW